MAGNCAFLGGRGVGRRGRWLVEFHLSLSSHSQIRRAWRGREYGLIPLHGLRVAVDSLTRVGCRHWLWNTAAAPCRTERVSHPETLLLWEYSFTSWRGPLVEMTAVRLSNWRARCISRCTEWSGRLAGALECLPTQYKTPLGAVGGMEYLGVMGNMVLCV